MQDILRWKENLGVSMANAVGNNLKILNCTKNLYQNKILGWKNNETYQEFHPVAG